MAAMPRGLRRCSRVRSRYRAGTLERSPSCSGQSRVASQSTSLCALVSPRSASAHDQVLVWDDMMTRWHGKKAKFVQRFADVEHERGLQTYIGAVRDGSYPNAEVEGFEMNGG